MIINQLHHNTILIFIIISLHHPPPLSQNPHFYPTVWFLVWFPTWVPFTTMYLHSLCSPACVHFPAWVTFLHKGHCPHHHVPTFLEWVAIITMYTHSLYFPAWVQFPVWVTFLCLQVVSTTHQYKLNTKEVISNQYLSSPTQTKKSRKMPKNNFLPCVATIKSLR